MIRPPFRNRIDVQNQSTQRDKISRHSSQLAIRKTSAMSVPHADNSDAELRNIKQTTFWVKKTIGVQGAENVPPNHKRAC